MSGEFGNWNPIGVWKVTTEGDVEGYTLRDLGVFDGHVVDIAAHLALRSYYKLSFLGKDKRKPAPQTSIPLAKGDERVVHIDMGIDSGTWFLSDLDRVGSIENFLNQKAAKMRYSVEPSPYFGAVILRIQGAPVVAS